MAFSLGRTQLLAAPIFENFDLINGDLSSLEIVKRSDGETCYVRSKDGNHYYKAFILDKNTATTTLCSVQFFKSSTTQHYIPRPSFYKLKNDGNPQICRGEAITINLNKGEIAQRFWDLMGFLGSFKELVDAGDFNRRFKVVADDYAQILRQLDTPQKIKAVKELIRSGKFSADDIKSLVYESRKTTLRFFLYLIKNKTLSSGKTTMMQWYKDKHHCAKDEDVWHHFLKENNWILGLNADIRFIPEFIDETKVGVEDSRGKGSPRVDMLGISNYTTLVELKRADTPIFKPTRGSGSRANTWEFSSEFISGISQCLGQKFAFDECYVQKEIITEDGKIMSKEYVYNADVKVVFIIGCRYSQFPHNEDIDNKTKSKTFELYRRNNRNVEIITYDELFERAYHIVMAEKIPHNWFEDESFDLK